MVDCAEVLADFLSQAPLTQRHWLASCVHFIVLEDGLYSERNHLEELLETLSESDAMERPWWVIKIAAAIDHALLPFGPEIKDWLPHVRAPQKHTETLAILRAQADLRSRHLNQMRADWAQLRASKLSPRSVCEFEHRLHSRNPGQA